MMVLMLLSFEPGFRFGVGDFGDVPEMVLGFDLNKDKWTFSIEIGRIITNRLVDSSSVNLLAEDGADTTVAQRTITAFNFFLTLGVRYPLLDIEGKRIYAMGGLGFQRPQMNKEGYPVIGDDFTYTAGLGGDVLLGTMFDGDFWDRTRLFLELKFYHLKTPISATTADYEWRNVLDWKVGVTVGF